MKYDDAEYFFLNFETDLDNDAANTHIGMFLAWCVLRGLGRQDPADERWNRAVARLKQRQITGGEFLSEMCDCKLMDQDLSAEGNAFAAAYYESGFGRDYAAVLGDQMPSTGHDADDLCRVPDTWANFDKLAPLLDKRYGDWKGGAGPSGGSPGKPSGGASAKPAGAAAPAKPVGAAAPLELSLEPLEGETPIPAPAPAPLAAAANAGGNEALESLESLQRRANAGDGEAWYQLGAEYITGERTPRDFTKAANAFEKAAQLGVAQAAFNLAVCYQNGDGREQDPKQMLRWFALAAEGGHGPATYFLAMAYRQGKFLQQDFVASNALMLIARARGVKEAAEAGVMAGSMAESGALATRLQEPGQLVATLSARRRALAAGKVNDGMDGWRDPAGTAGAPASAAAAGGAAGGMSRGATAATSRASRSSGSRSAVATRPGTELAQHSIGLGHVALLIGAVALVPLLMAGPSLAGAKIKALATALSLIGAVGVFVVSGSLRAPLVMRLVLTVLATIPFLGSFACMLVTWSWVRRRKSAP